MSVSSGEHQRRLTVEEFRRDFERYKCEGQAMADVQGDQAFLFLDVKLKVWRTTFSRWTARLNLDDQEAGKMLLATYTKERGWSDLPAVVATVETLIENGLLQ